jgi:hypothetical protein
MTLGVSLGDLSGNPGGFRLLARRAVPGSAAIAASDAGVVAAAWTEATNGVAGRVRQITGEQEPLDVVAALRPAGGSDFGSPEEVSPREGATTPVAAFDPRTGRPSVAWVATNEQGATLRMAERG